MYNYASNSCKLHHQHGCKKMTFLYHVSFIPKLIIPSSPLNGVITHIDQRLLDCESFEGAEIVEDTVSDIKLVKLENCSLFE